jgi:hypothetical protein
MCPFCNASVTDLAAHYANDDCPHIVAAFGAVTAAGKAREADTHYRLNDFEKADLRKAPRPALAEPIYGNRFGFVQKASKCRVCGAPAWKNGRCEEHEKRHNQEVALRYYRVNRERINRERREAQQVNS